MSQLAETQASGICSANAWRATCQVLVPVAGANTVDRRLNGRTSKMCSAMRRKRLAYSDGVISISARSVRYGVGSRTRSAAGGHSVGDVPL